MCRPDYHFKVFFLRKARAEGCAACPPFSSRLVVFRISCILTLFSLFRGHAKILVNSMNKIAHNNQRTLSSENTHAAIDEKTR